MKKNEKQIKKFLEQVEEKTDVSFNLYEQYDKTWLIEGEFYSDLGEDCIITLVVENLTIDNIASAMYDYYDSFDPEEHAAMWFNMHGERGCPTTSLRSLLNDADEQDETLEKVLNVMTELARNFGSEA